MRILVLQLARFGDIFQTWPVLSAIRRTYPDATIDILVRERYAAAATFCPYINSTIEFSTKNFLQPLIEKPEGVESSVQELYKFLDNVKSRGAYDQIINLSFSPLSSYLTHELADPGTIVRGYDRQVDGFLKMADDPSAYFYAQVGVGRSNRFHLTEIFSAVAGIVTKDEDFTAPAHLLNHGMSDVGPYVVFHLGASQSSKRIPKETANLILKSFLVSRPEKVYLVGSAEERIEFDHTGKDFRVIDLCGRTSLADLFPLVAGAKAVLAADSMLMQIANLTQTKILNVTLPTVSFWETGPLVSGSRVIPCSNVDSIDPIRVRKELTSMIDGSPIGQGVYLRGQREAVPAYTPSTDPFDERNDFKWQLIQAMYTGQAYPVVDTLEVALAFQRIHELCTLGLEQVAQIAKKPNDTVASSILDEVDHLMTYTSQMCSEVSPLVRWFLAEKSRIAPGEFQQIVAATQEIFRQLLTVTSMYALRSEMDDTLARKDLSWK